MFNSSIAIPRVQQTYTKYTSLTSHNFVNNSETSTKFSTEMLNIVLNINIILNFVPPS